MGKSLRKAINEYCKWCIYDPLSGLGNWRQQVTACTMPNCPLYGCRPVSTSHKKDKPNVDDQGEV